MPSKLDILARRERLQALEAQGITSPTKLAETLGCSLATVNRDIVALDLAWAESEKAIEFRHQHKRRLVVRAQRRYDQLQAEWERSKGDKERQRAKKITGGGQGSDGREELEEAKEGRLGDPAYMREMRENETLIMDLLGLEAPKQHEVKDTTPPPADPDLAKLNGQELLALDAIRRRIQGTPEQDAGAI